MSLRNLGIPVVLLIGLGSMPPPDPIPSKVRGSVDRGLSWLLMAQNRDGSWGSEPGMPGDISNTAMATIALMSTGSTVRRGKHHKQIRRAVDWSLRRVKHGISYGTAMTFPLIATLPNMSPAESEAVSLASLTQTALAASCRYTKAESSRMAPTTIRSPLIATCQPNSSADSESLCSCSQVCVASTYRNM